MIIADRSSIVRRNNRKLIADGCDQDFTVLEASTLHAVLVRLRENDPQVIITSDELAGGDVDLLISAVREGGFKHLLVLIARDGRPVLSRPRELPAGVVVMAKPDLPARLAQLVNSAGDGADGGADMPARPGVPAAAEPRTGEGILPFRVEERRIIETAIRRSGGNIGKAARALQISPSTIYRKIQSWYGELPPHFDSPAATQ